MAAPQIERHGKNVFGREATAAERFASHGNGLFDLARLLSRLRITFQKFADQQLSFRGQASQGTVEQ